MRIFTLNAVALATLAVVGTAHAQTATELNKVTVTGEGDKLGTGLLLEEDAPKARSSVSKAQLEKTRSSGNPFQALALLPGVNSSSYDATGLFGGNLRVRGFNSDQLGFTVNGAPVNDSGNFAVFPQEYIDQENLCSLYVTQGAPDADAPHVGASGGNVGIWSCAPENQQRVRVAGSAGQLGFFRLFARVDTGKVGDFKGFLSVSDSQANKWKGPGRADRKHLDAGADYDLGAGNKLTASLLYNKAVNNNFRTLAYASSNPATPTLSNGRLNYFDDFSADVPQHLAPVRGTVQNEASIASPPPPATAYAGYALNPFENYLVSGKANFTINDRARVEVLPYFWYGYGTGGTQQTSLREGLTGANAGASLHGGIADINGDRDSIDTVLVYRGSLTQTYRPGIATTFFYTLDTQKISGGFWLERTRHRQTQPAVTVDNAGNITDRWLGGNLLQYNDGASYQGRDWLTVSTGESLFVQDQVDFLDHKLQVTPAFSYRRLKREFTNFGNSGFNGGADYQVSQQFSEPLPSLAFSLQATERVQMFASIAKTFRAPSNFEYGGLGRGITFANGVGTAARLADLGIKPEKAVNVDLGARYAGDLLRGSVTVFYNKFKDRIASSYNVADNSTTDTNVGSSKTRGVEIEVGTVPVMGFSAYASGSYTKSTIDDNTITRLVAGAQVPYPIAGSQFPDTPKGQAALSLQWAEGPYLLNLAGKYTSRRALTLTNDVTIGGYTSVDLNAAWKLPNPTGNGFKNPIIRLNTTNLLSKKYYLANAGSGSNITPDASGSPVVYAGAPRFTSVTFQADY